MDIKKNGTRTIPVAGILAVMIIMVAGTLWVGQSAKKSSDEAVRSVSLLYLDELAGRREQVVADNLNDTIHDLETAIELMDEDDLSDKKHLEAYQTKMKKLFNLEKFAFVDTDGLIYTSTGTQNNIEDYSFDYKTMDAPEISILNLESTDKKVVIAVPVDISFGDEKLCVGFMQISMDEMLKGVLMNSQDEGTTFCNIYTRDGIALSNTVLGGLAVEDNLLEAMGNAVFDDGYSYDKMLDDFENGRKGEACFTYGNIRETLSYVPIEGTDWLLTYLIRESVISEKIGSVSSGIISRSILQSLLTALVLLLKSWYIIVQNRKNSQLEIEKEKSETASRIKQEELEARLALQDQLIEEKQQSEEQNRMITALASDYRSVYYLELDKDEGVCYQAHSDIDDGFVVGERFRYLEAVTSYADRYITEQYYNEFISFIQPDNIREGLSKSRVISYTYMVARHGVESYEMVRFAGVRHPEERDDGIVHNVGACFTDVDAETRKALAQQAVLSDALATAEQANKAKTAFLSNMSHEIRTPMNAIIGLDNIALNDPNISAETRDYLERIGDSADHLLNLINDILDMSRIESGRLVIKNEEFSFRKLIEALNTLFSGQCQDKGLEYSCHIINDVDDYYIGDLIKLRQVLINILGNAVKFTPEGGSVSLDVERKAQYEGKSTISFRISDTGIGMSEDFIPHIFDAFAQEDSSFTSKFGSSGLGLAISKNIVELMNGNIEVSSTKGEGTTFTVIVTLSDSERSGSDELADEIRPDEMSVLIIDDDPVACEHARLVLEKAGISSEVAESGEEGIEMVRLQHARREPYNLILIDWKMPGMDGVETTRYIRNITGDESAIIILTAYRWDDILEEALEAGVDRFISKPLFAATVIEEFKSALEQKKSSGKNGGAKAELEGRRILLAEDMKVNSDIITMVLKMRGMEAELAGNGRIAVEMFSEHPEGYYDAVLMDMRMPEMDGLEATRTIRALDREDAKTIPIIALTANAFDEDVQRSLQAGLNAHLSKPVQPDTLFGTLESLIK